jgi:hypothetical protein
LFRNIQQLDTMALFLEPLSILESTNVPSTMAKSSVVSTGWKQFDQQVHTLSDPAYFETDPAYFETPTKYHGTTLQVQDVHAYGAVESDVVMEEVVPACELTPCVDTTTQSVWTNQTEFSHRDQHYVHPKALSRADPAYFETDPAYFETPTKYPDKALQVKDAPASSAIQRDVVREVVTANESKPCVAELTEIVQRKKTELDR